jgi:hypothetical protein
MLANVSVTRSGEILPFGKKISEAHQDLFKIYLVFGPICDNLKMLSYRERNDFPKKKSSLDMFRNICIGHFFW